MINSSQLWFSLDFQYIILSYYKSFTLLQIFKMCAEIWKII